MFAYNRGVIPTLGCTQAYLWHGLAFYYLPSTSDFRNAFLKTIRQIIRESVRNMSIPVTKANNAGYKTATLQPSRTLSMRKKLQSKGSRHAAGMCEWHWPETRSLGRRCTHVWLLNSFEMLCIHYFMGTRKIMEKENLMTLILRIDPPDFWCNTIRADQDWTWLQIFHVNNETSPFHCFENILLTPSTRK